MNRLFYLIIPLLLVIVFALTGCADELQDGYQFGGFTHFTIRELDQIATARKRYCNANNDSSVRAAALKIFRMKYPLIPENGICGGIEPASDSSFNDSTAAATHLNNPRIREGPPDPMPA